MTDQDSRPFLPPRSRKRASKACLACRARKVRCDISQREGTCTNCSLDQQVCVVKPRPTRYRVGKQRNGSQSNPSPTTALPTTAAPNAPQTSTLFPAPGPFNQDATWLGSTTGDVVPDLDTSLGLDPTNHFHNTSPEAAREMNWGSPNQSETRDEPYALKSFDGVANNGSHGQLHDDTQFTLQTQPHNAANTHVIYSYYPFLKLDGLSQMCPEDLNFLESQSCFRIPSRSALDEFMREYFLHVHPSLPLVSEGDFWELYAHRDGIPATRSHMSLFVFQSMLFASCSFVSQATIRNLGFKSTRSAREAYFRRAKLLFDFNGERDSVLIAQGALLLAYNASTRNQKILNTFWLSTAIQFAKDADAHRYHSLKKLSPERKSLLKRLWWCCILRDRILPLGVRRPLIISSTDFDFSVEPLSREDFDNEITRSRVYDASTKLSLVKLLLTLCDLAVSLTEVIMMVYPTNDAAISGSTSEQKARASLTRIEACKNQLHAWFERATLHFPSPAGISDSHESIILYSNLMYMYYYSALLAIYHHEVLVIILNPSLLKSHFNHMCRSKFRVEEAAAGVTENLKELIQLKLAKHLPISVVAYAALPLVLHVLDVKLSATESQSARKRRRLDIYTKTMKGLQPKYDGSDEVFAVIGKMIDYMSLEKPEKGRRSSNNQAENDDQQDDDSPRLASLDPNKSPKVAKDWGDVLLRQPIMYLRLALTMDLSLSKGQFPDDTDFPAALQSENLIETRFPLYRITMGDLGVAPEPTEASERNRNYYHPNMGVDAISRRGGSDIQFTPMSNAALSITDRYVDYMNFPPMRMNSHSPADLGLSLCSGNTERGMQDHSEGFFDQSSNWVDTMLLGDEWLISPEATCT